MWSNGFSATIEVRPGWSAARLALAVVPLLAGLLGLALAGLPPALALLIGAFGLLAGGWSAWRAIPWSRDFVQRLCLSGSGEWRLCTGRHGWERAWLTASWVFPGGPVMGLAFESAGGHTHHLILFRQVLAEREWRRLLVRVLRH